MTTTTRFADALRGPPGRKSRRRKDLLPLIGVICGTLLLCTPLSAQDSKTEGEYEHPEHGNLAEIGAKLSNPVSDVWALFTEFDLNFSDGDINQGDAKVGGRMLFQPILPLPLFGEGDQQWKLITRPTVPILFSQPVPKGFDDFSSIGGIGDIQLPMLVAPPAGNWTLGLGATWLMPRRPGKHSAAVSGARVLHWSSATRPKNGWPASSRSTPSASATPTRGRMPATAACSTGSSTTCRMPGRSA